MRSMRSGRPTDTNTRHTRTVEVFKFATRRVVGRSCYKTLMVSGHDTPMTSTGFCRTRQNLRIIQSASREMGIPLEKFLINIERYANTSAASVPLLMVENLEKRHHQTERHRVDGGVWCRTNLGIGDCAASAQLTRCQCLAPLHTGSK